MQNHLGLNNILLNYYKWRQIIYCKGFCPRQWAQMTLVSNKIYIIEFPKRNFLTKEKHIAKQELYIHWKPAVSLNFTPPWYVSCKTDHSVYCSLDLGYVLYHQQSLTNLNFAKCKFTERYNETKTSTIFTVHNYC